MVKVSSISCAGNSAGETSLPPNGGATNEGGATAGGSYPNGDAGASAVRLETNRALTQAIALYRRAGYLEVDAFNDEPYAHHWFEKRFAEKG